MQTSVYQQLTPSSNSIRLIKILPGKTDAISCTLHTTEDLTQGPPYTALSYAWGPVYPQKEIVLHGTAFMVRENLWRALRQLRNPPIEGIAKATSIQSTADEIKDGWGSGVPVELGETRDRFYFVDAICINQDDEAERSSQVNLMGLVYSCAQLVTSWIGEPTADSERSFQYLRSRGPDTVALFPDFDPRLEDPDFDIESWALMRGIFGSTYWERLWIVQEILLANVSIILCGELVCSWHDLEFHMASNNFLQTIPYAVRMLCNRITRVHDPQTQGINSSLLSLVMHFKEQKCSIPQDTVFALFGLVQHEVQASKGLLVADYSKSLDEVFQDVLAYATQRTEECSMAEIVVLRTLATDFGVQPVRPIDWDSIERPLKESWDVFFDYRNAHEEFSDDIVSLEDRDTFRILIHASDATKLGSGRRASF